MRAVRLLTIACALGTGCLDASGMHQDADQPARTDWPIIVIGGGGLVLDCTDPSAAQVHVLFECDSATIYSCGTLSQVELAYDSGKSERFVDLHGQIATLAARGVHDGSRILSLSLPGGARNADVELAGRQRFDAPDDSCGPPQAAPRVAQPLPAR